MSKTTESPTTADDLAPLEVGATISGFTGGAIDIEQVRRMADLSGSRIVQARMDNPMPGLPARIPVMLNRLDGKLSSVKPLFEEYRQTPERKRGTAQVNTLESFIALTERHMTPHSVIFAETDWRKPSLTAIVDYHEDTSAGAADNGQHRIHYPFPLSEEWKAWIAQDNKPMTQAEFAEWIEDHLPELAAPEGSEQDEFLRKFGMKTAYPNDMVQLSRGLQVNVESRVVNTVVLQSGEGEITFDEVHKDANGNKLSVPGLFILAIAPFFGGDIVRIPVRLRYRKSGAGIVWLFKLYRPDLAITDQVHRDLEAAAAATNLPAYQGTPEMAAVAR